MENKATLIVWAEGTDPERIKKWLERLKEEGFATNTNTRSYDPEETFPTLYFP